MSVQTMLCVLIWSGSWTTVWAVALAQVKADRHLNSTAGDFINVTCTPVKGDGKISCEGTPVLPRQVYIFWAEFPPPEPVKCYVNLHTDAVDLPNVCQELPDQPGLTRCTATIPRHLLAITFCGMTGATSAVASSIVSSFRGCKTVCEVYSADVGSCVVNEECRLCIQDFREYFPGVEMEEDICRQVFHLAG